MGDKGWWSTARPLGPQKKLIYMLIDRLMRASTDVGRSCVGVMVVVQRAFPASSTELR